MPPSSPSRDSRRALLVLDASHTYEMVSTCGLEASVTCRDLGGFFDHVYTVHPLASLVTSKEWAPKSGRPIWYRVNDRHTFIEGKVGRFGWLERLFPVNFLLAQIELLVILVRLVRRENVVAFRVGDPLYLGLFGLLLRALTRKPMLIRVNANNDKIRQNTGCAMYPRLFRSPEMEERIEAFVLPRTDIVAALNQDNLDFALARGADPKRSTIFRIGNLLAPVHRTPPSERSIDHDLFARLGVEPGRYLLVVGRLQAVKMPEDALKAFAGVIAAGYDLRLFFAGDGEMRAELDQMAKALGVKGRVVFGGNQDQQALAQLIAHCALVISPLTGRALSECALGGAPIVAYNLDWQGELVRSGKTGALIAFRDNAAMTAAAIEMLSDPQRAKQLGLAARERALAILDPAKLDDHERDTYSRLLSGQPPQMGT